MEAAKEQESTKLLDKILPPRLEDAGLEDCALRPDSIKEAFLIAASAVKSRTTSSFTDDEEDGCVQDPWPEPKDFSDQVVVESPDLAIPDPLTGIDRETEAPGRCAAEKSGGVVEEGRDKVVVGGGDVEEKEKEEGCVDEALKGLKIGDRREKNCGAGGCNDTEEQAEKGGERPILTECFE